MQADSHLLCPSCGANEEHNSHTMGSVGQEAQRRNPRLVLEQSSEPYPAKIGVRLGSPV